MKGHKELQKLQLMLRNLEECNNLSSPDKPIDDSDAIENSHPKDVYLGSESAAFDGRTLASGSAPFSITVEYDEQNTSLLENGNDICDVEDDISLDEEENWLLETPIKSPRKPQIWLSEDVRTPELTRIKGTLASKLDLISIQERKAKLSQLLLKHNFGSHPESAPGRLYQTESVTSIMSLDWDYDRDSTQLGYGHPKHSRLMRSFNNDHDFDQENGFDDLEPLSLNFEGSPVLKKSVQVAPGPIITKRYPSKTSPDPLESTDDLLVKPIGDVRPRRGRYDHQRSDSCESSSNASQRRHSLSDRSDSSGDDRFSLQNSVYSSGSSTGSADHGMKRAHRNGRGHRILVPIASLFDRPIAEINEEKEDLTFYASCEIKSDQALKTRIETSAGSTIGQSASKSYKKSVKPRAQLNSSVEKAEESLVVKLPASCDDGSVIRRRGASSLRHSVDSVPKQRGFKNTSSIGEVSSALRASIPRPRTSAPQMKRNLPTPRGLNSAGKCGRGQNQDILPRGCRTTEQLSPSYDV